MLSSWAQDRIGRKRTLILANLAMATTGLAFYLSFSFWSLILATIICGLATGMSNPPAYALLSEISLIKLIDLLKI